jgi:hypothetical protein
MQQINKCNNAAKVNKSIEKLFAAEEIKLKQNPKIATTPKRNKFNDFHLSDP